MNKQHDFPCTGCGACCRSVDGVKENKHLHPKAIQELIEAFPYDHKDGVCEMLVDNKCAVYEDRPVLCNIEKVSEYYPDLTKEEYFKINADFCNLLQLKFDLPTKYRVNYATSNSSSNSSNTSVSTSGNGNSPNRTSK